MARDPLKLVLAAQLLSDRAKENDDASEAYATPLTANLVQDVAETAGDGLWFKIRRGRKDHLFKLRQPKLLLDDNVLKK